MTTSPTVDVSDYPARYFAAWNGRDIEAALQAFAATVTWNDPSLPATITTLDGARGFFEGSWGGVSGLDVRGHRVTADRRNDRACGAGVADDRHGFGCRFHPGPRSQR